MKRLIKVASVVALMTLLNGCIISPRHDNGWHRGVAADIMEATMEVITVGIMAVTIAANGQRCHTA